MKTFLKSLVLVFIVQVTCWSIFTILNETNPYIETWIQFIPLITIFILYLIYEKTIAKKWDVSLKRVNTYLILQWDILSVIFAFTLLYLVDINLLSGSGSWFMGLEYLGYGFTLILSSGIIILWKILCWIYKLIINKNNY